MKNLFIITMLLMSTIWSQAQVIRKVVVQPSTVPVEVTFTSTVKQTVTTAMTSLPPAKKDTVFITIRDTVTLTKRDTIRITNTVYKDTCSTVVTPPPVTPPSGTVAYLTLPLSGKRSYSNQSNIVIENLRFEQLTGDALTFNNCTNVTIRNCFFNNISGEAITMSGGNTFNIEKNLFNAVRTGVYPVKTTGNIRVVNNQFVNMKGPMPRGQYVQFNTCTGAGNLVENNRGECFEGESNPEDLISLFNSKGTTASPIVVRGNIFRGGGPSNSGGGIMAGDYGGQYIMCENNKLVNPGQYGIAASGGYNVTIRNNEVYADQKSWNNIAFYVADYSNGAGCGSISLSGNKANYTNSGGIKNNFWTSGECGTVIWDGQNSTGQSLSSMNIPAHLIDFITPAELLKIRGK